MMITIYIHVELKRPIMLAPFDPNGNEMDIVEDGGAGRMHGVKNWSSTSILEFLRRSSSVK